MVRNSATTSDAVISYVLEAPHLLTLFSAECQKLNVHLHLMSSLSRFAIKPMPCNGRLFVISHGLNLAHARSGRQPFKPFRQRMRETGESDTRMSWHRYEHQTIRISPR
jgi:hypothetical protein